MIGPFVFNHFLSQKVARALFVWHRENVPKHPVNSETVRVLFDRLASFRVVDP